MARTSASHRPPGLASSNLKTILIQPSSLSCLNNHWEILGYLKIGEPHDEGWKEVSQVLLGVCSRREQRCFTFSHYYSEQVGLVYEKTEDEVGSYQTPNLPFRKWWCLNLLSPGAGYATPSLSDSKAGKNFTCLLGCRAWKRQDKQELQF